MGKPRHRMQERFRCRQKTTIVGPELWRMDNYLLVIDQWPKSKQWRLTHLGICHPMFRKQGPMATQTYKNLTSIQYWWRYTRHKCTSIWPNLLMSMYDVYKFSNVITLPLGNFFKNSADLLVSPNTKFSATLTLAPEYWAAIKAL